MYLRRRKEILIKCFVGGGSKPVLQIPAAARKGSHVQSVQSRRQEDQDQALRCESDETEREEHFGEDKNRDCLDEDD